MKKKSKPYLSIEIERLANKEFYARIRTTGNNEITFQTEGHKNLLDVSEMLVNTVNAIQRGDFVIQKIKGAKPTKRKRGKKIVGTDGYSDDEG
jgi:hypothetical protein